MANKDDTLRRITDLKLFQIPREDPPTKDERPVKCEQFEVNVVPTNIQDRKTASVAEEITLFLINKEYVDQCHFVVDCGNQERKEDRVFMLIYYRERKQ